jgi:hypothetical protein
MEPFGVEPRRELRWQDLDHDPTSEPRLLGDEDPAHPAAAQLAFDTVCRPESGLQTVADFGHGPAR